MITLSHKKLNTAISCTDTVRAIADIMFRHAKHSSDDDWNCPRCKVLVFGSKNECSKCKTPRRARNDWVCPKCDGLIFASKAQCRKCKINKPAPIPIAAPSAYVPPTPTLEELEAKAKKQWEDEELLRKIDDYHANPPLCSHGYKVPYEWDIDCSKYGGYSKCAYAPCKHSEHKVRCYKCG